MLRLQAAASSCTQHVVLRFWSQVLCYACTLPHHLARNTSCYACRLPHHLARNTSCYAFGRKCYVTLARCRIILHATRHATLARCCIIFTQHVVLRFWLQVLCYACTLPHHLARNTSCYACTLLHHLYATRRATLLLGGWGGGWGGVGVGGVGGGGVITFLLLRSLGLFFVTYFYVTLAGCRIILHATRRATLLVASVMLRLQAAASSCTQHVMLRLHAAASSLRNTSCYAFGRKCYVTLARCRIILHATRHATLARGRIIFTQHVVLRCCWGGWVGLGGGGGWGGVGGGRHYVPCFAFANFFVSPSLLFSFSYVLWSRQHNSDYVCLGAMVTSIFLVSYNFTCPRLVGWCWKILFFGQPWSVLHCRCGPQLGWLRQRSVAIVDWENIAGSMVRFTF